MGERTDAQKLGQEPEWFTKNGKDIKITPMVIKDSRKFKKQIMDIAEATVAHYREEDWEGILSVVNNLLGDKLFSLTMIACDTFDPGDDSDRAWMEDNLTEADLQVLLAEAVKLNWPWIKKAIELGELGKLGAKMQEEMVPAQEKEKQ